MAQLMFEPIVNKIGNDDYLITPKDETTNVRCVMRCNGIAVDVITALYPDDAVRESVAEMIAEKYNMTIEEAMEEVNGVIGILAKSNTPKEEEGGEQQ